jgi:hypothetical protein
MGGSADGFRMRSLNTKQLSFKHAPSNSAVYLTWSGCGWATAISNDKISDDKISDDHISDDKISDDKISDYKNSDDKVSDLRVDDNCHGSASKTCHWVP